VYAVSAPALGILIIGHVPAGAEQSAQPHVSAT
jgi:hypothetical protein